MRIISKFKDYYDCVQAYGMDQTILYVRNKEIEKGTKGLPRCSNLYFWSEDPLFKCDDFIIGFCGKVYGAVRLRKNGTNNEVFCHSIEAVDKYFKENLTEKQLNEYYGKRTGALYVPYVRHRYTYSSYFDKVEGSRNLYEHLFIEKKCPIFVMGNSLTERNTEGIKVESEIYQYDERGKQGCILYNPVLKEFDFFKVFDPHTAYQEIFMYVAGVLATPMKPIPEISDDDMRDVKGFDKWSFRKEPSKKKK
jgi:hypothetical protein